MDDGNDTGGVDMVLEVSVEDFLRLYIPKLNVYETSGWACARSAGSRGRSALTRGWPPERTVTPAGTKWFTSAAEGVGND
jgi:hypothetical protein